MGRLSLSQITRSIKIVARRLVFFSTTFRIKISTRTVATNTKTNYSQQAGDRQRQHHRIYYNSTTRAFTRSAESALGSLLRGLRFYWLAAKPNSHLGQATYIRNPVSKSRIGSSIRNFFTHIRFVISNQTEINVCVWCINGIPDRNSNSKFRI